MRALISVTLIVLSCVGLAIAIVVLLWLTQQNLTLDKQVEILATVVANVLGILLGAILAYIFALRQAGKQREEELQRQRVANTFEMAKEFENEAMIRARCDADKFFVPRDGSDPKNLHDFYEQYPVEQSMPIFQVIHFYDRLTRLHEQRQIDSQLAITLFTGNYQSWYEYYFIYQCEYFRSEKKGWENWLRRLDWLLPPAYQDRKLKRRAPTVATPAPTGTTPPAPPAG